MLSVIYRPYSPALVFWLNSTIRMQSDWLKFSMWLLCMGTRAIGNKIMLRISHYFLAHWSLLNFTTIFIMQFSIHSSMNWSPLSKIIACRLFNVKPLPIPTLTYWTGPLGTTRGKFNSLRPSDATWRHTSWSTLVWVMAWHRQAPSHNLRQCWLNIFGVHRRTNLMNLCGI